MPEKKATAEELNFIARECISTAYARTPDDILKRRLRIGMLDEKVAVDWKKRISSVTAEINSVHSQKSD